jgi:hypothetical protein
MNLAYIPKSTRHPLFHPDQYPLAIDKLSSFGTGQGITAETRNGASKITCEIDDKNRLKNSLYPHRHFTKHLVGTFRKSPRKSDLNYESSSLLIRRLKNYTGFEYLQRFTHTRTREKNWNFIEPEPAEPRD